MIKTASLVVLSCFLFAAFPAFAVKPVAPDSIPGTILVNAEQAVEIILANPKLVVIDARHSEEYNKGHIEGAINLLDSDLTPEILARHAASKDTPLLIYCNGARCLRSSNAAKKAVAWGYKKIYWFRGGWNEWIEKKLPITK